MWLHGRSAIFTLFYAVHSHAAANTINNTGRSRTNARKGGTNCARNRLGFSEHLKAFFWTLFAALLDFSAMIFHSTEDQFDNTAMSQTDIPKGDKYTKERKICCQKYSLSIPFCQMEKWDKTVPGK